MNLQTLQTIFYVVGIICMALYTLLLIVGVILLFYIKAKITQIATIVEQRIEQVKNVVTHPEELAATVGAAVATTAIKKVKAMTKRKEK